MSWLSNLAMAAFTPSSRSIRSSSSNLGLAFLRLFFAGASPSAGRFAGASPSAARFFAGTSSSAGRFLDFDMMGVHTVFLRVLVVLTGGTAQKVDLREVRAGRGY